MSLGSASQGSSAPDVSFRLRCLQRVAALCSAAFLPFAPTAAQSQTQTTIVPFSLTTETYEQTFNSDSTAEPNPGGLSSTPHNGTVAAESGSTIPTGWGFTEPASGNTSYRIDNGSSVEIGAFSYGTINATDRALGSQRGLNRLGVLFTNDTGATITLLTIFYTGEHWRAASATADFLQFAYSVSNPSSLTTATWENFSELNFTPPNMTSAGPIDGNLAANRTALSASIPVNIAPGTTFGLRWSDMDPLGNDDGMGVDDFRMVATIPEPRSVVLLLGGSGLFAALRLKRRRG